MKIAGEKLKQARIQHFWTVEQAAEQLGVTVQTYIRWEKGRVNPHPSSLERLCNTFQLTLEQLGIQEDANHKAAFMLNNMLPNSPESSIENQPIWRIPASFTSFVGREQEIVTLREMFNQKHVRLVTLLGPGGIGKTRLSLQVAMQVRDYFVHGVCFIPLADVVSPDLTMLTIAQALGIHKPEEESLPKQIKLFLKGKSLLLILDSFEKVATAAPSIEELLASCPDLKFLATSRNKLYLQAEHEFSVSQLALPKPEDLSNLEAFTQLSSVRLFIQRVQAILPDFTITPDNAQVIAETCLRLDGLPLAIELAAARIKMYPPRALLERLSQSSQILKSHLWTLPERQQTLYNTVRWSYDLLDEQEQLLFRTLSIFRAGYTLAAAEALCKDAIQDVPDKIASLLDQSLIQCSGEEPRYTMLATVREYGLVFLQEHGELKTRQQDHAMYYLNLVKEAYPYLKGKQQKDWLEKLQQEKENTSAALAWLFECEDKELLLSYCDALGKFYGLSGDWENERKFLRAALAMSKSSRTAIRARVLRRVGHLDYRSRDLKEAQELLEESVDISRELGDAQNLVGALSTLGWVLYRQKSASAASLLLKECVDIARELGDKWVLANALDSLGRLIYRQGNMAEACQMLEESAKLARELSDKESLTRFLTTLVSIKIASGDITQADSLAQECIDLAQDLGTRPLKALALDSLAEVALFNGDYEKAASCFEARKTLAQELGDKPEVVIKQFRLGELALIQGSPEQAITSVQESLQFFRNQRDNPNIAAALDVLGAIKRKQGALGEAWKHYEEALFLDMEVENKRNVGKHLVGLARVALDQKRTKLAIQLFAQANGYLSPSRDMYPAQRVDYEYALQFARSQLSEETFAATESEGIAMTIEQILNDDCSTDSSTYKEA